MVNIDNVDLKILNTFKNFELNKEFTTCDVAKTVFNIKGERELRIRTSLIERRLRKLAKYGVIIIKKRGKKMYMLDDMKCHKALILNLNNELQVFQL